MGDLSQQGKTVQNGRLQSAGVPVLRSEYGTWVGFDSFGSPHDLYVRPMLAEALYGIGTDAAGLAEARRRG